MNRPHCSTLSIALCLVSAAPSAAALGDPLPYTFRNHEYSGWTTTVSGDVRTVGMAGATVGLPDSYLSSRDNPAGLALLMDDADENFTNNAISDGDVQSRQHPIDMGSFGLAAAFYPWAFSIGYVRTSREGMPYALLNSPEQPVVGISSTEWRVAASRVFFSNRISLGTSVNFGRATEDFTFDKEGVADLTGSVYKVGVTAGVLAQLNQHVLIGLSYAFPMTYDFTDASGPTTPVGGFYKPLTTPGRWGAGIGWVPNRIFRADISLHVIGRTSRAALLRDDETLVGQRLTLQPRVGLAYIYADYEEFRATLFAGTYYEMTRIEHATHRLHLTAGTEIKPWILTLGAGVDVAPRYSNILFGIGIDIIKVAQKLSIIPQPYPLPRKGMFPSAGGTSDEGLPRGLVEHWRPKGPDMNVIRVITEIPVRTGGTVESFKDLLRDKGLLKPNAKSKARAKVQAKAKVRAEAKAQAEARIKLRAKARAEAAKKKSRTKKSGVEKTE